MNSQELDKFKQTAYYRKGIGNRNRYGDHPDTLYINEEFYSVQGEGLHTGMPMYFVRLQGCEVGCYFCDTKYTWKEDLSKGKNVKDIITQALAIGAKWICVTGGEPYEQDFYRLCELANYFHIKTHIETSGTVFRNLPVDWITLSPKDLFSKKKTLDAFKVLAHEIKCVITKHEDLDYYIDNYYKYCNVRKPFILQMVDNKTGELLEHCLTQINLKDLKHARIMLQQHKLLNLR